MPACRGLGFKSRKGCTTCGGSLTQKDMNAIVPLNIKEREEYIDGSLSVSRIGLRLVVPNE